MNLALVVFAISPGLGQVSMPQPFMATYAQPACGRMIAISVDGGPVHDGFAGKLGFRDALHAWSSVCGDVRAPISDGQSYGMVALSSSKVGGNVARAGNIVAKYFYEARTPDQCAGLQIAVWE